MSADLRRARTARRATVLLAIALIACGRGGQARVVIPPGSSMRAAAESLSSARVVSSARLFRAYAMLRGSDRGIKAGTYLLRRNESWNSVIDALRAGKGIVEVVTIPEGYSLAQIAPLLATKLGQPEDSVTAAARDTAWIRRLGVPIPLLEGYLFPDTYTFPDGTSARAAVNAMLRRFEQVWRPEWTARLDSIGMTRHQVLTLASIVETEARLEQERPIIAAVYLNRLRDGMLLEADPTVQYARGEHVARVFYKDLAVESPYKHVSTSGSASRTDRLARASEHRRGTVPSECSVQVLRRLSRWAPRVQKRHRGTYRGEDRGAKGVGHRGGCPQARAEHLPRPNPALEIERRSDRSNSHLLSLQVLAYEGRQRGPGPVVARQSRTPPKTDLGSRRGTMGVTALTPFRRFESREVRRHQALPHRREKHEIDQFGIELCFPAAKNDFLRRNDACTASISAGMRHGIEGIREGHDARHEGNSGSTKAARISASVPSLMVRKHRLGELRIEHRKRC
jgi:UPF0755 protein